MGRQMWRIRVAGFCCFALLAVGLWAPEVSALQERRILATIGERVITLEEFQEQLSAIPDSVRSRLMTPQGLRTYLKGMVVKEVFRREAVRLGLDKDPGIQARLEEATRQIFYDAVVGKMMGEVKVDEGELPAYFEAHRAEFGGKSFSEVKAQVTEKVRVAKLKALWEKTEKETWTRWKVTMNEALLKEVSIPQDPVGQAGEKGHQGAGGQAPSDSPKKP